MIRKQDAIGLIISLLTNHNKNLKRPITTIVKFLQIRYEVVSMCSISIVWSCNLDKKIKSWKSFETYQNKDCIKI